MNNHEIADLIFSLFLAKVPRLSPTEPGPIKVKVGIPNETEIQRYTLTCSTGGQGVRLNTEIDDSVGFGIEIYFGCLIKRQGDSYVVEKEVVIPKAQVSAVIGLEDLLGYYVSFIFDEVEDKLKTA